MSRTRRPDRSQARIGAVFTSGYALLLIAFGVVPTLYTIFLAFTTDGAFAGISNFTRIFGDYRFLPAVAHVAVYLVVYLVTLLVFVVLLALLVHSIGRRWLANSLRFVYYIPGALAGASSVMLWLFLLDPSVSPVAAILNAFGFENFVQTVSVDNLPVIFTIVAFWTGAGGWIVIMYGALNNISADVMEAARIDGAGPVKAAWYIQIPLLRKWISYTAVMSLAAGTQLFVEPRVLSQASKGVVPPDYSLNQLAYLYAFRQGDFNGSAAISLLLLAVAAALSAIFVFRGGLFERD
ncbi:sugar ABC transporter permease [Plantibacter sp. MCCC 1A11337]|uniref:carbohydrate ABC transporter permease n=1 Tax=Plantibacter sp. CFBP 13570 TaxID=2775272 RepID=UPI001581B479|nr:sugar ABC transporter permease [Plantibacter sp. CFBP 13570]MBD8518600.1 sugar ABC transporter permease [Plantibacter sp. CFBP 8804]MBD8534594.1 sugar ABC transporter permease [Plantibacter sp. CFBP 13570]NUJ89126.1 sugar ABC transporter permease [Plantibacter sp. MCCC 1A11337]